jgi:NAD(P)-dependent dehydrogenase (short-subunit alcohol dehydrogenase family)
MTQNEGLDLSGEQTFRLLRRSAASPRSNRERYRVADRPVGVGKPAADAAIYLLSPLSRFLTGQELHVNGGLRMG